MAAKSEKTFVVDGSFVLAFLLPDERAAVVDAVFEKFAQGQLSLVSPELLPYEVLNGLKTAVLRKRIASPLATQLARQFLALPLTLEKMDGRRCWQTAYQEKLTIYDAAYLTLARTHHGRLLSFDQDLKPFSS